MILSLSELKTLLSSTGLPVVYNAWQESDAPDLPFIVYRQTGNNNFAADNHVHFGMKEIDVELYTRTKSPETEALVETALSDLFWTKTETYLDDEKCYEIIYEIEV